MKKLLLLFALSGSLYCQPVAAQKTIVQGKPTLQDLYPNKSGNLLFSTLSLSFPGMLDNVTATDTIRIFNNGNYEIGLNVENPNKNILAELNTKTIRPRQEAYIRVVYDSKKANDYGLLLHEIFLVTTDSIKPKKEIFISTIVEPYFAPLTSADSANAPRIKVSELVYDFAKAKEGTFVEHAVQITNTGKSDLKILSIKPACSCLGAEMQKKVLAPGESAPLNLTYNTTRKGGPESKDVTLYTNDPFLSKLAITVKGEVVPQ
jgi:hypothetical protein